MKRQITLITVALLTGCSKQVSPTDFTPVITYEYEDFDNRKVEFNDLFTLDLESYYFYIYSKSCSHCENIKQTVLTYVNEHDDIFLLPFSKDIPISNDVEPTIGLSSLEGVSILGTPSLLMVKSNILALNIAGEKEIINTLQNN